MAGLIPAIHDFVVFKPLRSRSGSQRRAWPGQARPGRRKETPGS